MGMSRQGGIATRSIPLSLESIQAFSKKQLSRPGPPRTFTVKLCLAETDEIILLPECQDDLTLKKLKSHLELLTGIPFHFQRLLYPDEADLPDESTFKDSDIVPGGTITMRIWRQDGWGCLVAAAAKGETVKLAHLGVTENFVGTTPYAELLGPEQKKEWVAHRAFVVLFVASHRGHVETAEFLLRHGNVLRQNDSSGCNCTTYHPLLTQAIEF